MNNLLSQSVALVYHTAVRWIKSGKVKVFMNKKAVFILILAVLTLCLSGCDFRSKEEKAAFEKSKKDLVKKYSAAFTKQAKVQYGKKAKVKKIKVEENRWLGEIDWQMRFHITGNLEGVVSADGETFDAIYNVKTNEISGKYNEEIMDSSVRDFFGHLNLDIRSVSVTPQYLPERVRTYKDILMNKISVSVSIKVRGGLKNITKEDFNELETYWKEYDGNCGSVTITQLNENGGRVSHIHACYNDAGEFEVTYNAADKPGSIIKTYEL
jgi:outer membrane lipoprotein-sorting protein